MWIISEAFIETQMLSICKRHTLALVWQSIINTVAQQTMNYGTHLTHPWIKTVHVLLVNVQKEVYKNLQDIVLHLCCTYHHHTHTKILWDLCYVLMQIQVYTFICTCKNVPTNCTKIEIVNIHYHVPEQQPWYDLTRYTGAIHLR